MLIGFWPSTYTRVVWASLIAVLVGWVVWKNALTLEVIERTGKIVEGIGGKILILLFLTLVFFIAALSYGYYTLDAVQAGTIKGDDTLAIMLIEFVTGTAFGTSMGALVMLLGGDKRGG
jgi:hypothetical protein